MPDLYWIPLACAVAIFVALWPLSVRLRDASIVDFVWAPGFLLQLAIGLLMATEVGGRALLVLALVGIWSARLTVTLVARRLREGREDPRYTAIRESWGPSFWWKSLFLVFVLQAVIQWAIASGAIAGATAADQQIGWLAIVGAVIALSGLALETVADMQLDRFRRTAAADALMTTGLRRHVRHPNYSGEIVFWTGVALVGIAGGAWLALVSPLLVAAILILVSGAPMLDEHLGSTRPGWEDYRRRTPAFLPFGGGARARQPRADGPPAGQ